MSFNIDNVIEFIEECNKSKDYSLYAKKLLEYMQESKEFVFDMKGHLNDIDNKELNEVSSYMRSLIEENLISFFIFFKSISFKSISNGLSKKEIEDYIYNPKLFRDSISCSKCGEKISFVIDFKNKKIIADKNFSEPSPHDIKRCEWKSQNYSFELSCPSGKLVFANYFRGLIDSDKYDGYNLNSNKGLYEHTMAYAKDNIGYVQVGNSSPSIYVKNNKIILGSFDFLDEYKEYKKDDALDEFFEDYSITKDDILFAKNNLDGCVEKGFICTDLWAVNFMDYDLFLNYLNKAGITEGAYDKSFYIIDAAKGTVKVNVLNADEPEDKCLKFSIDF